MTESRGVAVCGCLRLVAQHYSPSVAPSCDAANHIAVFRSHDFKTCYLFNAANFEEHVIMLHACAQAFKLRVSKTAERSAGVQVTCTQRSLFRGASNLATIRITLRQIRLSITSSTYSAFHSSSLARAVTGPVEIHALATNILSLF
jgi:hypothetical protein